MTPSARLAATAAILDNLDWSRPVEPQLKAWARANRYAGSKDRRAIADRIYTILRRRRTCAAPLGGETGRALVLGSLSATDRLSVDEITALCSGGYGLAALTETEITALASPPNDETPAASLDWPDWLYAEAEAAFGSAIDTELDALRQRAPVDLRVNLLKSTLATAQSALHDEGFTPETVPDIPTALRLPPASSIARSTAFADGLVELQDASSQAVALFAQARAGQTVLDFCAGAGGKTLALAAMMDNTGALHAYDVNPERMRDLLDRATRAGASPNIIRSPDALQALRGQCDIVLVDAPCSGSGSWRRDPLAKWRLSEDNLTRCLIMQREAIDSAASFVKPGGHLIYATCSILPVENTEQSSAFSQRNQAFALDCDLKRHTARDGGDGFYAARFIRIDA